MINPLENIMEGGTLRKWMTETSISENYNTYPSGEDITEYVRHGDTTPIVSTIKIEHILNNGIYIISYTDENDKLVQLGFLKEWLYLGDLVPKRFVKRHEMI